jgi:cellobiose-specific phosphotransferase system component IIB
LLRKVQLGVAQIADAWSEAEAEQMHESKDVVGEARGVGAVLLDPQIGFMVKQSVKDVGGVAHTDVDDFGTERRY